VPGRAYEVTVTGAGMRARSYHPSPGKIKSLSSYVHNLWTNWANTSRRMCGTGAHGRRPWWPMPAVTSPNANDPRG
jgi:hypothetical protein